MDWTRDLPDWPLSSLSHRIRNRPHDWHVQISGAGRTVLLLHGAAASTHSWRDMIPALAHSFHVVALDLPGQGFSRAGTRRRLGLTTMSEDIAALCAARGWQPHVIIGHSAGAALALDLARHITRPDSTPPDVIGINAALDRFEGVAGWLFPVLAKVLALNPLTATAFTLGRNHAGRARRLIESTGSTLDEQGLSYYARLIADRDHVEATLQMMAQWDIDALLPYLPAINARCLLITGARDAAVSPEVSERAARLLPAAETHRIDGLGHLAHEEDPTAILKIIFDWLARP